MRKNSSQNSIQALLASRSIVLVGMMGCGKTAIGRLVADSLKLPFFDADEEVEKAAGMNVADIFSKYGEEEFRSGEQKVISRLLNDHQCILALGGGAFVNPETRELVAQHAISLWLNADIDVIVARVARRPGKRPLLLNREPREVINELMRKRSRFYKKADIKVETSSASKMVTRNLLVEHISEFLKAENVNDK